MNTISLRTLLTLFIIHVSWNYFINAETISPTVEERSEISSDPKLFDSNSITDDDQNHVDGDVPETNNDEEEPVPDPMIIGDTFSSTGNDHENSSSESQSLPAQLNEGEVTGTPTKLLLDDPLPADAKEEKEEKEEDTEGAGLEVKMEGEEDTIKITVDSDKEEEEVDITINKDEMVDEKEEMKQDDDEKGEETSPKPETPASEIDSDSHPHPSVVKVKDEGRIGRQEGVAEADFDSSKIWCYSCNSIIDEACNGDGGGFVGGVDYQCDCNLDKCRPSGVETYRPPVGCMKIVQQIPDHPEKKLRNRIVRRCAYSDEVHEGRKAVGNKEVKIWSYQCNNTNECNKAGSLKLTFGGLTIIVTSLLGVFSLITFRI